MSERSLDRLGFGWQDHKRALWWLGLLYRKPWPFRESLEALPWSRQLRVGGWLLLHTLPWAFLLSFAGRVVLVSSLGTAPGPETVGSLALDSVFGVARGIAVGIAGGIAVGIAGGIAVGIAFLTNLDGFLPSHLGVVWLSMQSAQANASLPRFLGSVSERLGQAVPGLDPDPPQDLADFEDLLSAADAELERRGRRLLFGIDEYEYLDRRIGEGSFSEDLLGSLRESIQRHRNLVWMFAGSHEITELAHAQWTSYLVSVRTVEVPPFQEEETRLLLTEPLRHSDLFRTDDKPPPSFHPGFWGENGIERVHAEAGGWPHLVQLVAETLVDQVNDAGTEGVTPELFERSLDRAVVSGHNVLHQLLREECSADGEWTYLTGFATRDDQPAPSDPTVAARLRHRLLLVEDGDRWRLRAPLMGRWLRQRGT